MYCLRYYASARLIASMMAGVRRLGLGHGRARQHTARSQVSPRVTVAEYAERWLGIVDQLPRLKPATRHTYRDVIERVWLPRIGTTQLRRLDRETVRDILLGELAKGRASNTVTLWLTTLGNMLRWAIREDQALTVNPVAELGRLLGLTRERVSEDVLAFDRAELDRFLGAARVRAPGYLPIFFFMARTGVRPSEARSVKWEDLDAKTPTVRINRTFGFKDHEGTPKTRRSRRAVDLSPQLVEALKRHRLDQAAAKLAHGWPELPAYLFTTSTGQRLGRRDFERAFQRVLGKAGLPTHYSPKSLRHTYASILLSEGASPLYVSRQLGHTSTAITERVYTRWIPQPTPAVHRLDGPSGSNLVATARNMAESKA
jgi:integrase